MRRKKLKRSIVKQEEKGSRFYKPEKLCFLAIICLCTIWIFVGMNTCAKTYYTSVNGSDKNNGTQKRPFQTIQHGIDVLHAGDMLLIKKGTYKECLSIQKKGTKKHPITIKAAEGEKVVISGKGKKAPVLLRVGNSAYVTVDGIHFTQAKGVYSAALLVGNRCSNFHFQNNQITQIKTPDQYKDGHYANPISILGTSTKTPVHHIYITNNTIKNCATGITEAIQAVGNCEYISICSNIIDKTGNIGIDIAGNYGYCKDPSKDFARHCVVENNVVRNCRSKLAASYGIYVDGAQDVKIRNNTVEYCTGGIEVGAENKVDRYCTSNITIEKNKLNYNTNAAIGIGGYRSDLGWVKNVKVKENRCKNNGMSSSGAALILAKCKKVVLENNQFLNEKSKGVLLYNEFSEKYTKQLTFRNNSYQIPAKRCIVLYGKYASSKKGWIRLKNEETLSHIKNKNRCAT